MNEYILGIPITFVRFKSRIKSEGAGGLLLIQKKCQISIFISSGYIGVRKRFQNYILLLQTKSVSQCNPAGQFLFQYQLME